MKPALRTTTARAAAVLVTSLLAVAAAPAAGAAPAAPPEAAGAAAGDVDRQLLDPRITESSGLARSGYDDELLWTHNDRGHAAELFQVGPDGRTRATVTLGGVTAVDWEALSRWKDRTGTPRLFVADIGDNTRTRDEIVVHEIAEPALSGDVTIPSGEVTTYRFRYASGRYDAETLMVHPWTGRLYVVTKSFYGGRVFEAPEKLSTTGVNVLHQVAEAPATVTDGTFLFDGRMVLRDYQSAYVSWGPGEPAVTVPLPATSQGESLAPLPGNAGVYVGSEGWSSPVYRQSLPVPPG